MADNTLPQEEFLKEGAAYFRQMRLENQAHVTIGLQKKLEETNKKIESLERSLVSASESSSKVAKALNWLTAVGAAATVVIAVLTLLEWFRHR